MATQERRILRVPETERRTGYKRPSLYRKEADGSFPRRVKLGQGRGGAIGWFEDDVEAWLAARACVPSRSKEEAR